MATMDTPYRPQASVRAPNTPDEIRPTSLLGICTSLKPAQGRQGRSAARSLLVYTLDALTAVYSDVFLLDLRDYPPPLFDGRMPQEHEDLALQFSWTCVDRAGALLLSVPAYWCGVSGVFKNFIDVLCGPAYDMEGVVRTVFSDKPVGLLVVGADEESTRAGTDQAQEIMRSTGAMLVSAPVMVSNPRNTRPDENALSQELLVLGAELARHAYLSVSKA